MKIAFFALCAIGILYVSVRAPDWYDESASVGTESSHESKPPALNIREQNSSGGQISPEEEAVASAIVPTTLADLRFTDVEIIEMNEWLTKHGFKMLFNQEGRRQADGFLAAEPSSYSNYATEILSDMAEADEHARLALGLRLYDERNLKDAKPYLLQSAKDGFAMPLVRLYDLHVREGKQREIEGDWEADDSFVEAYAWQHVFNLRFLPDNLVFEDKWNLRVSAAQLEEIKAAARLRGEEIYRDLVLTRNKEGLGEFDNETPKAFELLAETRQGS